MAPTYEELQRDASPSMARSLEFASQMATREGRHFFDDADLLVMIAALDGRFQGQLRLDRIAAAHDKVHGTRGRNVVSTRKAQPSFELLTYLEAARELAAQENTQPYYDSRHVFLAMLTTTVTDKDGHQAHLPALLDVLGSADSVARFTATLQRSLRGQDFDFQ